MFVPQFIVKSFPKILTSEIRLIFVLSPQAQSILLLTVQKLENPRSRTARKLETSFVCSWEKSFESIYSRATLFSEPSTNLEKRSAARKGIRTLISNFSTVGGSFITFLPFIFISKNWLRVTGTRCQSSCEYKLSLILFSALWTLMMKVNWIGTNDALGNMIS